MNRIHIIDDEAELISQLGGYLKFELGDPSIELHSYHDFESFTQNLDNKGNDDIYIIDYNLGPGKNGFDVYRALQRKVKYPKALFYTAFSEAANNVNRLRRNPTYDNFKVISKSLGPEELIKEIKIWLPKIKEERVSQNLIVVKNDIQIINQNLTEYILRNPKALYDLHPRKFEELVAELFSFEGYSVELTPESNDGGKDIYAYKKDFFNEYLFAVECKKFSPHNKVGRPIAQKLNGVVEHERLTGGILVTSSFYTKPAKKYTETLKHRIFLNDYHDLMELIKKHGNKTDYNKS